MANDQHYLPKKQTINKHLKNIFAWQTDITVKGLSYEKAFQSPTYLCMANRHKHINILKDCMGLTGIIHHARMIVSRGVSDDAIWRGQANGVFFFFLSGCNGPGMWNLY